MMFKVGDRVATEGFTDIGTIISILDGHSEVRFPGAIPRWLSNKDIELIDRSNSEQPIKAVKHDQIKPDLSLLPKAFLDLTAQAFMYGEAKYGRYNFMAGLDHHRVIAAALRHITAYNDGENIDPESSINHLGHASACLAMLIVYQSKGLGKDTRFKKSV